MKPKRIEILGMPVDCVVMQSALDYVETLLKGNKAASIIAVNPEKVIKARKESILLKAIQNAGLLLPDGIGVVWGTRLLKLGKMERVAGADLMPAFCERATEKGYKIFLFGAKPQVNEQAVAVLRARYPGIQIVDHHHGYVSKEQMPTLIKQINDSKAEILFLALGSPHQEIWMAEYLSQLENIKVCQGVGGTFDVVAGIVQRAPAFIRKLSFEWLYRLISQPSRLIRQTALPKFAYQILACGLSQLSAWFIKKLKKTLQPERYHFTETMPGPIASHCSEK